MIIPSVICASTEYEAVLAVETKWTKVQIEPVKMWKQIKIHHKSFHGQLGAVELMKKMMADISLPYNVGEMNLKDEPFFRSSRYGTALAASGVHFCPHRNIRLFMSLLCLSAIGRNLPNVHLYIIWRTVNYKKSICRQKVLLKSSKRLTTDKI